MSPRLFAVRPSAPHCRGGVSSLLRLSSGAAGRWPSATMLTDWASRLAPAVEPAPAPMVAPSSDTASPLFTRLWPSGASNAGDATRLAA
jgi:nicotinamidase-related amidase